MVPTAQCSRSYPLIHAFYSAHFAPVTYEQHFNFRWKDYLEREKREKLKCYGNEISCDIKQSTIHIRVDVKFPRNNTGCDYILLFFYSFFISSSPLLIHFNIFWWRRVVLETPPSFAQTFTRQQGKLSLPRIFIGIRT